MTEKISNEYTNGTRLIVNAPIIELSLWKLAAVWAQDKTLNHIIRNEDDDSALFYVPSSKSITDGGEFTISYVRKMLKTEYTSFDQYKELGYGRFWTVSISKNSWLTQSHCDCPKFLKAFKCKHFIGLALRMKLCTVPAAAIPTALGTRKARGCQSKSTKALLLQTR